MTLYDRTVKPLLFRLDPEQAHDLTLSLLGFGGRLSGFLLRQLYRVKHPALYSHVFNLGFQNPLGLAAGYDKNGRAVHGLAGLGFGHVEVGTITVQPQEGNEKPRVFRLPEHAALINRMGFPNEGLQELLRHLPRQSPVPVGINIGKASQTPLGQAHLDYVQLMMAVYHRADYIAINISSPNTLNLRQLQAKSFLASLLARLASARDKLTDLYGPPRPILIKVAPDLTWAELDDVLDLCLEHGMDGVIATNTTTLRPNISGPHRREAGGLSGQPLRPHSTEVIRYIYQHTQGKLPVIGVGGVNSTENVLEKMRAGASLVQLYTGLVYGGPGLVRQINLGLAAYCEREGLRSIAEIIGADAQVKPVSP